MCLRENYLSKKNSLSSDKYDHFCESNCDGKGIRIDGCIDYWLPENIYFTIEFSNISFSNLGLI